jgi:hypothetical protein
VRAAGVRGPGGWRRIDSRSRVLDVPIHSIHQRVPLAIGSRVEVARFDEFMPMMSVAPAPRDPAKVGTFVPRSSSKSWPCGTNGRCCSALDSGGCGLAPIDRWLWVVLRASVPTALVIVRPETVISWHRQGFRLWWTRGPGAPSFRITSARSSQRISSWSRLRPTDPCSSWYSSPTMATQQARLGHRTSNVRVDGPAASRGVSEGRGASISHSLPRPRVRQPAGHGNGDGD